MKLVKKIKSNKGVSGTDIAIALSVLIILGGTIANMFYTIYYNIVMVRMNAMAVNYAVNILEYTDKILYEEVENGMEDELTKKFDIPDAFDINLKVENYNEAYYVEKTDIVKILTLTINYTLRGNTEQLAIKKLKVKEL